MVLVVFALVIVFGDEQVDSLSGNNVSAMYNVTLMSVVALAGGFFDFNGVEHWTKSRPTSEPKT